MNNFAKKIFKTALLGIFVFSGIINIGCGSGKNGLDGKLGKPGLDGKPGNDGLDGKDGIDGRHGIDGKDGLDGKNGIDGRDGRDGRDGNPVAVLSPYKFTSMSCKAEGNFRTLSFTAISNNSNAAANCGLHCVNLVTSEGKGTEAVYTHFTLDAASSFSATESCNSTTCSPNNTVSCTLSCSSENEFGLDVIKSVCT